jgi:hypothetical protein
MIARVQMFHSPFSFFKPGKFISQLDEAAMSIVRLQDKENGEATAQPLMLQNPEHPHLLLSSFARLREQQILCDLILIVQDERYYCHRALLCASCPFFEVC